ncbi:MAG: hypothetical protein ACRES3_02400 [Steroidobacteraceae bacterium]
MAPLYLLLLSGCENGGNAETWRDLGLMPAAASTLLNHTPMVVSGERVLVGTSEGIWARPLDDSGSWQQVGLDGVSIFATRRHLTVESTLFAAGHPVLDIHAAPFYRSDDGGNTWVPSAVWPQNSFDQSTEPFFDLAIAPDDPDRLYANLSGPSVAISTDGGITWALANGETEVFFGDPCVMHVLESDPATLFQGCEAPLDNAWVATQDIDPADPFMLTNFTFVAGGPDLALENRRPNSFASGPARPETLYTGLEGALIALDETGFEFVFRAEDGATDPPYAYITGIWLDPDDADHLIFGGGVNGENAFASLFETRDHGMTVARIGPPHSFQDPAVEQIVQVGSDELAVLISDVENPADEVRSLNLFVLEGIAR